MENKVVNKQITIESIVDVANRLEDYKEKYESLFKQDEERNKGLSFSEKNYEYPNGSVRLSYRIEFHNGKNITESDFNWFVGNLSNPRAIKEIAIDLTITYMGKTKDSDYNDVYNKVSAYVEFRDAGMNLRYSDATVSVETTNQQNEAHNLYSTIMNALENNKDRYDKTIKHRKIRMQSLCISVGIILSYILYIVLKMNTDKLAPDLVSYLNNKNILIFGQWLVAIVLGNVSAYWYILLLYKPLLPEAKYAGYNRSTYESRYTDDMEDYLEHSEVHFGKFWDAEKRRNKIEMIYKVTSKIILVQILISAILFFVLK